jgi:hypothetical protein
MSPVVRPLIVALTAAGLLLGAGLIQGAAKATDEKPRPIGLDQPRFWRGEPVAFSGPESWEEAALLAHAGTAACGNGTGKVKCFTDYLDVPTAPDGAELRVAIEHRSGGDVAGAIGGPVPSLEQFALALISPSDEEFATSGMVAPSAGNAVYTPEVRVVDPDPGVWQIRIIAIRVRNDFYEDKPAYRVRANLVPPAPVPEDSAPVRDLLPNLQATPPFELIFAACDPDDLVQPSAGTRCLRFAQGPVNVGAGPLDLEILAPDPGQLNPSGDPQGENIVRAREDQIIHRSDGGTRHEFIGWVGFHTAPDHMHYHHPATGGYELLAADPETKAMRPAAPGTKVGYCLGDYYMANWRSFDQEQQRSYGELFTSSNCAYANLVNARFGLSPGWGDAYSAGLAGNALEFGDNPDGYYVIRAATNLCPDATATTREDCRGDLVESNYEDNVSYTYFRVENTDTATPVITEIERGFGTGPYDPNRQTSTDYRFFLHPPLDPVPQPD